MKKTLKLITAACAALFVQQASAVTLYGDGGQITIPGGVNFDVASVYENIVIAPGQELKGFGEINAINGSALATYCADCELTFTFSNYFATSVTSTGAAFTGGVINVYLGFGANNDFAVSPVGTDTTASALAKASNGALFLTLTGHAVDGLGNTLKSTVNGGDLLTPTFSFTGTGLWDVNLAGGGLANANFDTNSLAAAFGAPFADLRFNTSGDTLPVTNWMEPTDALFECAPTGPIPNLTNACVGGSADIRGRVIPEPGSMALLGLALLGLGAQRLRSKKQ